MEIAPDFFSYFTAVSPLLDRDPTLLAASAWNDNGMADLVGDPSAVYRSDFFPGLGWMMKRRVWKELGPKWPDRYWDDWLREPQQRRSRHFLRPEVCRTYHFGKVGTSGGQFSNLWERVHLNNKYVDFRSLELLYLANETLYDQWLFGDIASAQTVSLDDLKRIASNSIHPTRMSTRPLKTFYESPYIDFPEIARGLGLYTDLKAGIPRTAYKGVVTIRANGKMVHVVPRFDTRAAE